MKQKTTEPVEHPQPFQTLANKITILRIVLIPAIVIAMLEEQKFWIYSLLIFSMLTDFLDGLAARWKGERTRLGAFLDPMADKLMLTAVFITLTYLRAIPTWVFVVIFSRDLLIVLGWAIIYILTGAANVTPKMLGKVATAAQMVTAFLYTVDWFGQFRFVLLWITIGLTIASAVEYILMGEKHLGGVA